MLPRHHPLRREWPNTARTRLPMAHQKDRLQTRTRICEMCTVEKSSTSSERLSEERCPQQHTRENGVRRPWWRRYWHCLRGEETQSTADTKSQRSTSTWSTRCLRCASTSKKGARTDVERKRFGQERGSSQDPRQKHEKEHEAVETASSCTELNMNESSTLLAVFTTIHTPLLTTEPTVRVSLLAPQQEARIIK